MASVGTTKSDPDASGLVKQDHGKSSPEADKKLRTEQEEACNNCVQARSRVHTGHGCTDTVKHTSCGSL